MKVFLWLLIGLTFLSPLLGKPKNIILFIADGTGIPVFSQGMYKYADSNLEQFKTIGLVKTYSLNDGNNITDSAAAGTAIACGVKTKNGVLGLMKDGKRVESVLELSEKKGKSTGLVVLSSLTHATPASFYAHVFERSQEEDIALSCAESGIEVLFGGGYKFFEKSNALVKMKKIGYQIIQTSDQLQILPVKTRKVLGLFSHEALPKVNERTITLQQMTDKAIQILSQNTNGFFLMVEGSEIDWAAHENNAEITELEFRDFDLALRPALEFLKIYPDTLILVTADHETGGAYIPEINREQNIYKLSFSTKGHTGEMVPLFAKGDEENLFSGIYENTNIANLIKELIK